MRVCSRGSTILARKVKEDVLALPWGPSTIKMGYVPSFKKYDINHTRESFKDLLSNFIKFFIYRIYCLAFSGDRSISGIGNGRILSFLKNKRGLSSSIDTDTESIFINLFH